MKFLRVFLLIAAVAGGSFAGKVYNQSLSNQLAADPQASGLPLKAYSARVLVDAGAFTDVATGNLIKSDLILTNWHAIRSLQGKATLEVELADGGLVKATVVKSDKDADLALLKLDKPTILPTICPSPEEPVKGTKLTIRGFAKGHEYREVSGKVAGRRSATPKGKDIIFLVNCTTVGGMSGSAAMDENNQMGGIVFGCRDGFTNCTGVKAIMAFLENTEYWTNN